MADAPLCLLTVHAHPDDESSKGAGTVAMYHERGVRTVLVCCTGGEEGEILNPALDDPANHARLADLRLEELERATAIIGYDEVVLLGYRDSGMPDSEAIGHPEAFAGVPLAEAAQALAEVIRRERPQVVITYGDDQEFYPHPDHIRVHDATIAALDLAADPAWSSEAGEPWTVAKLYYTVFSMTRIRTIHERMRELGVESPFSDEWFERPSHDHRITSQIDVSDYYGVRRGALLAHATQVSPDSPFWFGLPDDELRKLHPYEEYVLARGTAVPDPTVAGRETDLFAGLGSPAWRST